MSDAEEPGDSEFDDFLAHAREKAANGRPVSITIRSLIGYVGAERRGARVIREIQHALEAHGLTSEPSFASGWVDNRVEIRLAAEPDPALAGRSTESNPDLAQSAEVALTVRNLESATAGVTSVDKSCDLLKARALMLRHDFSQLAVTSGPRQLVGAVSWESMALASIRNPSFTLADATVQAPLVDPEDDLIALIPTIADKGFVFVRSPDRTLAGIVTTADLGLQFATLAGPFLLIGEIERRLRQTLAIHFDVEVLQDVRDPGDTHRTIDSANDLTLGETLRVLEKPANWERLGWPVDRAVFVEALDEVREIRNEVMHFSPDPLSRSQHDALMHFVGWLRAMEPTR